MNDLEELIKSSREISGIDKLSNNTKSSFKIHKDEDTLIDIIKTYSDVCKELNEKEYSIDDFLFLPEEYRSKMLAKIQIEQIAKLFNGNWIPDYSNNKELKYFPYFIYKAGSGWVYIGSICYSVDTLGSVVYKSEKISVFIGKQFLYIYREIL